MKRFRTVGILLLLWGIGVGLPASGPVRAAALPEGFPAQVDLAVGDVRLLPPGGADGPGLRPARPGERLAAGEILATGADSRAQLTLGNGHLLQVGPQSRLAITSAGDQWSARLVRGGVTLFALPGLRGVGSDFRLGTPRGWVVIGSGKVALAVDKGSTRLTVFDNRARWHEQGAKAPQQLHAGQRLISAGGPPRLERIARSEEETITAANNPEHAALARGIAAFKAKKAAAALGIIRQVHAVYPYNPDAAYHLGLIQMTLGRDAEAIAAWRRFQELDPQGARKKKIAKHLTLLVSRQMEAEVQAALSQERRVGDTPPEPNSVAVPPFINAGDEKYRILAKGISAMVIADLSKVPGLKVLERAKMQRLVDEIKLSESGLVSEKSRLRAGKLLKAEKIILGDYKVEPE